MEDISLAARYGRSAKEHYGRYILGSALWKVRRIALWKVLWQRAVEGPQNRAMEGPLAARCGRSAESRYGRYILGSALWKVRGRALWKRCVEVSLWAFVECNPEFTYDLYLAR
ncbi:hypothetical protein Bbelb_316950 [Branchiostoma belcheri]|nr:hypothetical protein Bbelb_316950 [Branchiostoma belcheri]